MTIGILAFQGDVAEHAESLNMLGQKATEIRTLADCTALTHVIIPGGESTVIARFLEETKVGEWIRTEALKQTIAVFGTCAGAILIAEEATGKHAPRTLDLIDITVERNAYGTQRDSFETDLTVQGIDHPVKTAFIRAPRITRTGSGVSVLATHPITHEPVLVQSGRILAGTSHPEVRGDASIHQLFLSL